MIPHSTYVEPFVGMGGVFLRRPFRVKTEVINDISQDVITLFRVLQRHYVPLMDMLRWGIASRAEFERQLAVNPDTLTDLERAVRFLYLQRVGFGGNVMQRSFGLTLKSNGRYDVTKLASVLEAAHQRLSCVVIERLPWRELLTRYDRPTTLFYLDPPYWGCEQDYGAGVFARQDFNDLAAALAGLQGRFLLSMNDRPEVRAIFAGFAIEAVETSRSFGGLSHPKACELLISPR